MSRKLSTSDFCNSCLEIGHPNDPNNPDLSVKGILNGRGYALPSGYMDLNSLILYILQENGGCSSCINMVKQAT